MFRRIGPCRGKRLALACVVLLPRPAGAAWPVDPAVNVPICTQSADQLAPAVAPDGAGGAIVVWEDGRDINHAIYAQHVRADGSLDPVWPVAGLSVTSASDNRANPSVASDGAGGALVAWQDFRGAPFNDIYATHVMADGTLDPAWPVNGLAVCTASDNQMNPAIDSDGTGGAVVAWQDFRNAPYNDIYAAHVKADGTLDPDWPVNGRAVCTAPENQTDPAVAGDGAGGAIVAWQDFRSAPYNDIYAAHVKADGTLDPNWAAAGIGVCTAPDNQTNPAIAPDGAGGAVVAWQDFRSAPYFDIYAEHVRANGTLDPAWTAQGAAVCMAADDQTSPAIAPDGAGGAIVAWQDFRSAPYYDIYAQHVMPDGTHDPAWAAQYVGVCTAGGDQVSVGMGSDGAGGAIVAWQDFRSAPSYDIYAQGVRANGQLGGVVGVRPEPSAAFALESLRPNPARGRTLAVRFVLPDRSAASLELVDVAGRTLAAVDVGALGAGPHALALDPGRPLPPGLYLVRLRHAMGSRVARLAVVR